MSIVTPHTISPVRPVPASIPRPEYAWKDAPQPYRGSHVQSEDVIERMRFREVGQRDALSLGGGAGGRAVVPSDDLGAACAQRGDGGHAGAAETEDGDAVAGIAADGNHASTGVHKGCLAHAQFHISF